MNTSELRIGNIVQHKTNKEVVNVIHVLENHIGYHNKLLSMKCIDALASNFEPIHLNEDWVLRLGFKINRVADHVNCDFSEYILNDVIWVENDNAEYNDAIIKNEIKFIHQLQNLYYCLVGEELVLQDGQIAMELILE